MPGAAPCRLARRPTPTPAQRSRSRSARWSRRGSRRRRRAAVEVAAALAALAAVAPAGRHVAAVRTGSRRGRVERRLGRILHGVIGDGRLLAPRIPRAAVGRKGEDARSPGARRAGRRITRTAEELLAGVAIRRSHGGGGSRSDVAQANRFSTTSTTSTVGRYASEARNIARARASVRLARKEAALRRYHAPAAAAATAYTQPAAPARNGTRLTGTSASV